MTRWLLTLVTATVAIGGWPSALAAQARDSAPIASSGSGIIAGVVSLDVNPPRALRRVTLTLSGGNVRGSRLTLSDDAGRFVFDGLSAGRYTLVAEKAGFVKTFYGSRRAGRGPGIPIALEAGSPVTDVSIRILPGAVIAGTVRDEQGGPLASAQVHAMQPLVVAGERTLVDPPNQQYVTTDDRGRYRLYGLAPGEYTVVASGSSGMVGGVMHITETEIAAAQADLRRGPSAVSAPSAPSPAALVSWQMAYYPGVANSTSAELFKLAAGEERGNVDVTVPLVFVGKVQGTIVGPDGEAITSANISIVDAARGQVTYSPGAVRPGQDGHFESPSLSAGQYTFVGRTGTPVAGGAPVSSASTLWAETTVTIDRGDVAGVVIKFERGMTVAGRIVFQGPSAAPDPATVHLELTAVSAAPGSVASRLEAVPQSDGTFAFAGLAPGKYRVAVQNSGPWSLRSAMLNGKDTLDVPFEVRGGERIEGLTLTFIDRPAQISGRVLDQLGRSTSDYALFVFAADRSFWTTAPRRMSGAVKPDSTGQFHVDGLPPGDYYVAVLIDADPRELGDPSFLDQLIPSSIRVTLAEGERKIQDLKLGGLTF